MTIIQFFIFLNIFVIAIMIVRGFITRNLGFYGYMVWNIFLAIIPLLLALNFENVHNNLNFVAMFLVSSIWLLFLPNAFYLITDMMHLNQKVLVNKRDNRYKPSLEFERGDPWYIFDSSMLYLISTIGMIAGGVSLYMFHELLNNHYSNFAYIIFIIVLILAAIGIYLGRYSRWNSWDALIKPHKVLLDFLKSLKKPSEKRKILIVTLVFLALEILSWQAAEILFDSMK